MRGRAVTFPTGPQKRSRAWPGPTEPDTIDLLDELRATFPRLRSEHRPPSVWEQAALRIDNVGIALATHVTLIAFRIADAVREIGR